MSQLKKHTKFKLANYIRLFIQRIRLGRCGKKVYFEKHVSLLRFPKNIKLGDFCHIKSGTKICTCNENAIIDIGKNTSIGYNTIIFSSENIIIGSNCMIAPNVYIVDSDHGIIRDRLMKEQENVSSPIIIGNDVWVATGSIILKGTKIPDGCVIAANSVVKGQLEAYAIYAGSPAKKVGERQ
ncbi:acyltransferase [Morganella morganii]|uniref:acyltransferase n=1 Tax=Morganella morganii TaxID=582 RepID=UPI0032DBD33B